MDLITELGALERRWAERGAPVDEMLLPGLPSEDVQRAAAGIHDPHPDVVTWFGWHNGSRFEHWITAAPSGRLLTPLDDALELRQILLDQQTELRTLGIAPDDADPFAQTWLPVATTRDASGFTIATDLVTGEVYRHDNGPGSEIYPQDNLRIADNLASLVSMWCAELDRGSYIWDSEARLWQYDAADQPADLHERNIIR